jgi:hypothetical protein
MTMLMMFLFWRDLMRVRCDGDEQRPHTEGRLYMIIGVSRQVSSGVVVSVIACVDGSMNPTVTVRSLLMRWNECACVGEE